MAQTESIDDALSKRLNKSLLCFMQLCDPERKYTFDRKTIEAWNRLALVDQQKLYLYLLYRKWRGIDIFGEPYYIIMNCHPVPFNWNGQRGVNELVKTNRAVIARHNGEYGTYTRDEARLYCMTDVKSLN